MTNIAKVTGTPAVAEANRSALPPESNNAAAERYYFELDLHNKELRQQLRRYQEETSHLRAGLENSHVYIKGLEAQVKDLEQRRSEAVATLFRLRPQRQECTETEVKEDYHMLKDSIERWVEQNCEDFLDNEHFGFEMVGKENSISHGRVGDDEIIIKNFRSQSNRWNDAKDQVLIAIIMRYIFNMILSCSLPVGLSEVNRTFLQDIEKSMRNLEPQRGKFRITIVIENHLLKAFA
jgi:hypothetical protein